MSDAPFLQNLSDGNLVTMMKWLDVYLDEGRDELEKAAEGDPAKVNHVAGRIFMIRRLMGRVRSEQNHRAVKAREASHGS